MTQQYTTNYRLPIPQFNQPLWHNTLRDMFQAVDNLIYNQALAAEIDTWQFSTTYLVGDIAIDAVSGTMYQCRVSHTSSASGLFSTYRTANPTHWIAFAPVINPRGEWANSTAYAFNDWVYASALGVIAICTTAHTSSAGLATITDDVANWSYIANFPTNFAADDIVYNNDVSLLVAANMQDAIDEVEDRVDGIESEILLGDITIRRPTRSISSSAAIVEDDQNKTIYVTTASGSVTLTMPALAADDDGWEVTIIKTNTGVNPIFIAPDTGTILSGQYSVAQARRAIPGKPFRVMWTGTAWVAERCIDVPVGSVIPFHTASLPVGFEWPNGQTLTTAVDNYPEFYAANGNSGVTRDRRGRVSAGKDDMGGSSANRLTALSGGVDGDTLGATGGAESHTLTTAELPTVTPAGTIAVTVTSYTEVNRYAGGGNTAVHFSGTPNNTSVTATATFTGTPFGSDDPHNNVQPTMIENLALVVE